MLAKSDAYEHPRIYALDRIHCLTQTKQSYKLPKGFEPKETFRKLFGVILDNGPVENVLIRVSEDQVKYYRTLPLHHSQEEGESGDGYTIEVISPIWLRKEIARELRRAIKMYDDVEDGE